jgi:hypothetical protein
MAKLKFQKRFEAIRDLIVLRGETILLEVLPKEEIKTEGGLYLGAVDTHRATADDFRVQLGLVLLVGEDVKTIKPGEYVMLPFNPRYISEFPGLKDYTANALAFISEESVLFKFESEEKYEAVKIALNTKAGEQ